MTDRLFVAVAVPDEARARLETFAEPRRDADPDLRWVRPENWHLTLAFLGDVPADRQEPLADALAEVADRTRGFTLALGGAGAFPKPYAAKVLWLGVTTGRDELGRLAARVRTACQRVGVPPDPATFAAHLTLARTRRPVEATRWLRVLEAFPQPSWRVERFVLVDSTLNRGGSVYRVVGEYPLGDDPVAG